MPNKEANSCMFFLSYFLFDELVGDIKAQDISKLLKAFLHARSNDE
jgi:hypothetical protein